MKRIDFIKKISLLTVGVFVVPILTFGKTVHKSFSNTTEDQLGKWNVRWQYSTINQEEFSHLYQQIKKDIDKMNCNRLLLHKKESNAYDENYLIVDNIMLTPVEFALILIAD